MDVSAYVQDMLDWTEKHPGLAGWVGAIGAIVAIFVAWGLARAEYLKTKRQMIARRNGEITLIRGIIHEFDSLLNVYGNAALANDAEASTFYTRHFNDA